jgi:serine/threonine protein kinase
VQPEPPLGDGRAHLVDFGLLTPLRGTMTLTTHGTEYFRDPEMVRMALRGVKVHEVDGARFDVYGAGAVLYAVLENSFPASGGLSPITRACPEALKWVVRRAMTDYARRYPSAAAMLADLRVVQSAARAGTLSSLRVTDLPSMRDGAGGGEVPGAGSPAVAVPSAPVEAPPALAAPAFAHPAPPAVAFDGVAAGARRSAREQLQSARARIAERRHRARCSWAR